MLPSMKGAIKVLLREDALTKTLGERAKATLNRTLVPQEWVGGEESIRASREKREGQKPTSTAHRVMADGQTQTTDGDGRW